MALPTKEGYLYMHRTFVRKWERRFFKLTRVYLQYYETKHSLTPKGSVIRTEISSVRRGGSFPDKDHCFVMSTTNSKWHVVADSEAEMDEWIVVISAHLPATSNSASAIDEVKVDLSDERAESPTVSAPPLPSYMAELLSPEEPPPYDECV